ncbi:MAG: hypothetical protein ACKOC8_06755 [Pirellulales bacterium]
MGSRDDDTDSDSDGWDDDPVDDDGDEESTVPCPFCGREMFEDSPRCPSCERYVSDEDHAASRKPTWVIVTAVICLVIAVWWLFTAP